jgi:hypothetical protein
MLEKNKIKREVTIDALIKLTGTKVLFLMKARKFAAENPKNSVPHMLGPIL